jgi:hypothetical protein
MPITSVSGAKAGINVSVRESCGGRSGLDSYGRSNFSSFEETAVNFGQRDIPVLPGSSAGMRLPNAFRFVDGVVFGVPMSQAAWDGLSADYLRDNACVCSDADFPVGSRVLAFLPLAKPGAQVGGFAGLIFYGKPTMELPQGVMLKTGGTTGAPGTATIQASTDGGTTYCTAYVTVASGENTVKDSAGTDTGLRFRLTTTPNFATGDTTTIDVEAPGAANIYMKKSPETWTAL